MVSRVGMALVAVLFLAPQASADSRVDYLLHCGGCHLEDGSGSPPEVPDLRNDLDRLAATVEGRSYLTRVPGASQVPLSNDDLAAVFNWIFETYYPNGEIEPFTGREISRTRYEPLLDPLKSRAALNATLR
jgi:cytochrome c553